MIDIEKYCIDKVHELAKEIIKLDSFYASKKMARYKLDKSYIGGLIDAYNDILCQYNLEKIRKEELEKWLGFMNTVWHVDKNDG